MSPAEFSAVLELHSLLRAAAQESVRVGRDECGLARSHRLQERAHALLGHVGGFGPSVTPYASLRT